MLPSSIPTSGEVHVPAIGDDAYWKREVGPLLEFLQAPRTWSELMKWTKSTRFHPVRLRHALAYMEDRKLAVAVYNSATDGWHWRAWNQRTALDHGLAFNAGEAAFSI